MHENVIGFQERCRQMVEIVRAKKLQKLGATKKLDKNQDGTGSLQTIPITNNHP